MAEKLGVTVDRWRRMTRGTGHHGTGVRRSNRKRTGSDDFATNAELQPDHAATAASCRPPWHALSARCPTRYQKVVFLYYTNDMTMKEIGDRDGRQREPDFADPQDGASKMAVALESEGIESVEAFERA